MKGSEPKLIGCQIINRFTKYIITHLQQEFRHLYHQSYIVNITILSQMPQQFTNFHSRVYIYRQSQRIYSPISPIYHKAHKTSLIYQSCIHILIRQGSGYLDVVTKGYHSRRIFFRDQFDTSDALHHNHTQNCTLIKCQYTNFGNSIPYQNIHYQSI